MYPLIVGIDSPYIWPFSYAKLLSKIELKLSEKEVNLSMRPEKVEAIVLNISVEVANFSSECSE
jgi:hypothetical protein